jgi:hypothetical protein
MSDIPCTRDWDDPVNPTNPSMVPPCNCPRCAAEPLEVADAPSRPFLRVAGQQQRLRVEPVDLGPTGRELLG